MAIDPGNNHVLIGLAVALGIGLLIGIEREQRKGEDPAHIVAGVRTFVLIALAGAISTLLGTSLIAVGAAFVALAALASYQRSREADPGLTTEVAMFVAFLLGVLAMSQRELAAGIPGATVHEAQCGHAGCVLEYKEFVPALVEAANATSCQPV